MNLKTIRSTVVRALAAGAMIAGVTAIVSGTAHAASPFTYYASPTGSAANVPCTSKANPCTLQQALTSEAANSGGVAGSQIVLKNGTYSAALGMGAPSGGTLVAGNNNVVITGKKASKVFLDAPSADVTGGGGNRSAIDFTGTTGITVQKLIVEGGNPSVENAAGGGVVGNQSGTNATLSGVTVENGGAVNDGVALVGGSTTLANDNLTKGADCSTTSTASPSVASTWGPNGFLNITKYQKCAPKSGTGSVTVVVSSPPSSTTYTYNRTGKKTLELTGAASNPAIPAGSQVIWAAASGAFTQVGIVCAGGSTVCNIDPTTVSCSTVANPSGPGQTGIAVTSGANATINASATGCINSDFGNPSDPSAQPGVGIATTPTSGVGAAAVTANASTSNDDIGVIAEGCLASCSGGSTTVNFIGGTYAGNSAGVALIGDNPGNTAGRVNVSMQNTSVSGTALGVGMELEGSSGQTFGPPGTNPANTNTFSGNGVGVAFGELSAAALGSSGNKINNAVISGNTAFGVEVAGPNTPQEFTGGGPAATVPSPGNSVTNTAFSTNGQTVSEVSGANIVDFDAYLGPPVIGAGLHTTVAIPIGGAPSSNPTNITLKNTTGGSITVHDGQPLVISGLGDTLWVDNGSGISHIVANGSSFTFSVNVIQLLSLGADPATAIPAGTAVSNAPYTPGTNSDFGALSGNSSDNAATSGPGTPDSCNALTANSAGIAITAVTTSDGGLTDC